MKKFIFIFILVFGLISGIVSNITKPREIQTLKNRIGYLEYCVREYEAEIARLKGEGAVSSVLDSTSNSGISTEATQAQTLYSFVFMPDQNGATYVSDVDTWYSDPYCSETSIYSGSTRLMSKTVLNFTLSDGRTVYASRSIDDNIIYTNKFPNLSIAD